MATRVDVGMEKRVEELKVGDNISINGTWVVVEKIKYVGGGNYEIIHEKTPLMTWKYSSWSVCTRQSPPH